MYALGVVRRVFTGYLQFVGKRIQSYWTAPLLRQPEQGKRLSAAQRCNEDVLLEIFAEVSPRTLASAACVCRVWLSPARDKLYHDLLVENTRSAEILVSTLTTNPWIRSLVRRLQLRRSLSEEGGPIVVEWIALPPAHSLLSVKIGDMGPPKRQPSAALDALLDFPAIRTTPRLFVSCRTFLTPERLDKVLRMPQLDSLSFRIPMRTTVSLKDITAFPKLRRLSISAEIYPPLVAKLIHGLPSPLERFDLLTDNIKPADLDTLRRVLYRHAPHLRHLALFGGPISQLPSSFMDDFVLYCPALEVVVCPDRLYTPRVISRLPSTLRSLALCTPDTRSPTFPINEYATILRKYRAGLPQLQTLTVVNCQRWPLNYSSLKEVCQAEGIVFQDCSSREIDLLGDTLFHIT